MKRQWEPEELTEQWTLLPTDMPLLANRTGATRLGFAVLLLFFHHEGRFPQHRHEIARAVVALCWLHPSSVPGMRLRSAEQPQPSVNPQSWSSETWHSQGARIRISGPLSLSILVQGEAF